MVSPALMEAQAVEPQPVETIRQPMEQLMAQLIAIKLATPTTTTQLATPQATLPLL